MKRPALRYRVQALNHRAHLFAITLEIDRPAARQKLALPVWIPGSYLVREFSQHLQSLQATQGGQALPVKQLDKHRWQVDNDGKHTLCLRWEVYAFDASVRTAFLDATRGFFNATSLCLMVADREDEPHALEIAPGDLPAGWQVATGLRATDVNPQGFGHYLAPDYDELADCPVELGTFWSGEFIACGVPHRFVVGGAGAWLDGPRLLDDTRRICEAQIRFWHGDDRPPFDRYVFMLHASGDGYGGLEHRNSTALIAQRADLPQVQKPGDKPAALKATDGYTTLLGLISHEYFHTWNVKRLRPADFARYDYGQENYTQLLWFFEGFTSYYDDLLLRRAGLLDDAGYLKLLNKTLNQVQQTPGRALQSVAQASFDAWVKYYRPDENTANATVSYYTKGALVALCLDLTLRRESRSTLDAVMRALWKRCKGGPMTEADLLAVLQQLGGRDFSPELTAWVHGTHDLPVTDLLALQGVTLKEEPAQMAQRLGLRVTETGGLRVKQVLRGGAAERAGMAAGDEWLGVESGDGSGWRLLKLDDLAFLTGPDSARANLTALVARDGRLLRLPLRLPDGVLTAKLSLTEPALAAVWLAGKG